MLHSAKFLLNWVSAMEDTLEKIVSFQRFIVLCTYKMWAPIHPLYTRPRQACSATMDKFANFSRKGQIVNLSVIISQ